MSDETGIRFSVLCCVSGCYAEVHISWENIIGSYSLSLTAKALPQPSFTSLSRAGFVLYASIATRNSMIDSLGVTTSFQAVVNGVSTFSQFFSSLDRLY